MGKGSVKCTISFLGEDMGTVIVMTGGNKALNSGVIFAKSLTISSCASGVLTNYICACKLTPQFRTESYSSF